MRLHYLILLTSLTGCGDFQPQEIKLCKRYLEAKLRSPSTLSIVKTSSGDVPYPNPRYRHVSIEYDAANAYGTPVRDRQACFFPIRNGQPVTDIYINHDEEIENALKSKGMFAADANMRDYGLEVVANRIERSLGN